MRYKKILVEEREYSEVSYYFMQEALKYKKRKKNTLSEQKRDIFLTLDF